MLKGIGLLHKLQFNTRFFQSTSPNLKKRISNEERAKFQLDPFLKQVSVGNILGDVYLRKVSPKANIRLIFRQGSINSTYLLPPKGVFFISRICNHATFCIRNRRLKKQVNLDLI
jgi:hypothetical protein